MFHIILYQPEIPPNTGNIIRLCANTGCKLHLIQPLGFSLEEKSLRRAGLDYHEWAAISLHDSLASVCESAAPNRLFALTTKGKTGYHTVSYQPGDFLLFGPETRGLPSEILEQIPPEQQLRIPQQATSRSLNLSNCVSIVVYEALRQQNFHGLL
jgi:tRNA (cytidine/uridine-2'-O-)-methyltransferase